MGSKNVIIHKLNPYNFQDVHRWINFPFELYKDVAQWIPPLVTASQNGLYRQRHPFFAHSEADFWIAEVDGKPAGRISVMENKRYNQYAATRTAFFGFFESTQDQRVAGALFDAAFEWAKARDLVRIVGPRGLIGADSGGILVEGFEHRAALDVPYNLAYYDQLITACGFEKDIDHLSGYLRGDHRLPERITRIAENVKEKRGYWIKSFSSAKEMRQWAPKVIAVHRQAFANTHTFYPPTQAEIDSIVGTLVAVAHPHLIKLVMKGDEVIGFIFAYHDISPAIQKARGRLWPVGWLYILAERKRADWVNVNGVGLLPSHQGLGGNTVLYTELDKSVKAFGFKHVEIIQVNETNFTSRSDMESIGTVWYKRHRSYKRQL